MRSRHKTHHDTFQGIIIFQHLRLILTGLFISIIGCLVLYNAWLSDDAMITLRTILNWHHGYGLVFNPGERVQGYTHPLWMLLITGAYTVTRELFMTTFILSTALTMLAAYFITRYFSKSLLTTLIACCGLIASKAFIEYGTSGLENPLSYALIGLLIQCFLTQNRRAFKDYFWIICLASLLFLCRMDYAIVTLPIVIAATVSCRSLTHKLLGLLWGILPALTWLGFSILYYGTPFPNTYYAKLYTNIPKLEYFLQGLNYTLDLLTRDLSSALLIAIAIWAGLQTPKNPKIQLLTLSLGLYLLYILYIGGDFMSGRFFAVPAYLSAIIIAQSSEPIIKPSLPIAALIFGIGMSTMMTVQSPFPIPFYPHLQLIRMNGVADERAYLFTSNALMSVHHQFPNLDRWDVEPVSRPKWVKVRCGGLGYGSLTDGPEVHYIDTCALTDPLLARLPYYRHTEKTNQYGVVALWRSPWRIGHFTRQIPNGYYHTIQSQTLQIDDPQIAEFYQTLRLIIQGPIFTRARFLNIWQLNTGQLDHLIDVERYGGG